MFLEKYIAQRRFLVEARGQLNQLLRKSSHLPDYIKAGVFRGRADDAANGESSGTTRVMPTTKPAGKLSVGDMAPVFTTVADTGNAISSLRFKGRLLALFFCASDCEPCFGLVPRINAINRYHAKDVSVLYIVQEHGKPSRDVSHLKAQMTSAGIGAAWSLDEENKLGKMFSVSQHPTMVIIGKTGRVEQMIDGCTHDEFENRVRAAFIQAINNDRLPGSRPAFTSQASE